MRKIKIETVEYLKPKPTVIYYANIENKVVGSSILYKVNYFKNLTAYEVSMTRVIPEYRGRGIAQKLFDYFLKDKNPDIVCGFTNNPLGVLYRQKSCRRFNMRSFFGNFDLDLKKPNVNSKYDLYLTKYLTGKKIHIKKDPYFYIKNKSLSPDIPDLTNYPEYLKKAFEGVVTAQTKTGSKKVAVYPLINIKKSLI